MLNIYEYFQSYLSEITVADKNEIDIYLEAFLQFSPPIKEVENTIRIFNLEKVPTHMTNNNKESPMTSKSN